jgi:hypothetical protein
LDHLGAGLQPLERAVEILGRQVDHGEGPLRHHLEDGAPLVVRDAGVNSGGRQDETDAETARRAGEEVAGLLAEVGLVDIETRQLDLDPPMVLVVGTRTG